MPWGISIIPTVRPAGHYLECGRDGVHESGGRGMLSGPEGVVCEDMLDNELMSLCVAEGACQAVDNVSGVYLDPKTVSEAGVLEM